MSVMLRSIFIEKNPLREFSNFNATMAEGIKLPKTFSYIFLFLGIVLLILALMQYKKWLLLLSVTLLIWGWVNYQKTQKILASRTDAFINGQVIWAEVLDKGERTSWFHFGNIYFLSIKLPNNEIIEIFSTYKGVLIESQVGTQIMGLQHQTNYLFGEELSGQFKLFEQ